MVFAKSPTVSPSSHYHHFRRKKKVNSPLLFLGWNTYNDCHAIGGNKSLTEFTKPMPSPKTIPTPMQNMSECTDRPGLSV